MYNDVDNTIKEEIKSECKKLNSEMLMVSKSSLNDKDGYLYLVLAKRLSKNFTEDESYIVWYYNSSLKGLNTGAYMLSFKDALVEFSERLR